MRFLLFIADLFIIFSIVAILRVVYMQGKENAKKGVKNNGRRKK